jgi:hypothetical protein
MRAAALALEFPESRENNREFSSFFACLVIFSSRFKLQFQHLAHKFPNELKQGLFFTEQGIDPPEQGITGIFLL